MTDGNPSYRLTPDRVLLDDGYLLGVDKPAGIPCQHTPQAARGSLYDAVQDYVRGREPGRDAPVSVGMPQRIDRHVSGVVVFSVHRSTHRRMTDLFRDRLVEKHYLAVVEGVPRSNEGLIDLPLARRLRHGRSAADPAGLPAVTKWRVLACGATSSLLELIPVTGRSHQIRVHLAGLGFPILGDLRYGSASALPEKRILLHAWKLSFPHPLRNSGMPSPVRLEAPVAADFASLVTQWAPGLEAALRRRGCAWSPP